MSIKYYSTNGKSESVSFKDALIKGLAPDGGLYMPDSLPTFSFLDFKQMQSMNYAEIAYKVAKKVLGEEINHTDLAWITTDAYNYDVPLEMVTDDTYVLRLDRGPTASFKDFAARMMGRLMQYFLKQENRKMLILTATSGDTGSAVASAFYGLDNIEVVVLYPEKEVSERQRKQMTTLHKNITVLALDGKFDDCQALVKQAFNDRDLDVLPLSSANSINIGRLIPQSIYYFYAYSKLVKNPGTDKIIFSVPSGNFGNLMGGLLAKKMGLPVEKFVISTNDNNEVPTYFKTGKYSTIVPSRECISSAMNVGHPSNMARIISLYGGVMDEHGNISKSPDIQSLNKDMFATFVSDDDTKETIKKVWKTYGAMLEPHGAVAWKGLTDYIQANVDNNCIKVVLETAHPSKFPNEIIELIDIDPILAPALEGLDKLEEIILTNKNNYADFKDFLLSKYKK